MVKIRNALESYLRKNDLTQLEFARLLEARSGELIDPSTICRWLGGSRKPDKFWSREIERVTKGAVARTDW